MTSLPRHYLSFFRGAETSRLGFGSHCAQPAFLIHESTAFRADHSGGFNGPYAQRVNAGVLTAFHGAGLITANLGNAVFSFFHEALYV